MKDIRDASMEICELYNSLEDKTDIVQHFITERAKVFELESELALYERALELACDDVDNYWETEQANKEHISLQDYMLEQARKELSEQKE